MIFEQQLIKDQPVMVATLKKNNNNGFQKPSGFNMLCHWQFTSNLGESGYRFILMQQNELIFCF